MSDPLAELRATFFLECDELLEKLETALLELEAGSEEPELINTAFRAVHSIKGGAGAFELPCIVNASHIFETALDQVRSGVILPDAELYQLFLRGKDHLSVLIGAENGGEPPDPVEKEEVAAAFAEICREEDETENVEAQAAFEPVAIDLGAMITGEPLEADTDLDEVEDEGFIDFEEEWSGADAEEAAEPVASADAQPPEELIETPAPATASATVPRPVVRVELSRVDRLINLVSELVVSQSMLSQAVEDMDAGADNRALEAGLDEFRQLTRELQEGVMAIRAEPVRSMFMRMGQITRSSAQLCGKKVRLVTEGEHTEIDKTVIERLAEPLTHIVRNAVDHGIETAEDRIKADKDPQGTVRLSAEHQSGRVVLTITDDGGGIDRQKVRQKAVERGIIRSDAPLSDEEIDLLLFEPGFSTATSVSELSGRGVGMDVVKREINALGGRIGLTSEPGKGATISISLPLTLAVLDGMVIRVAEQTVVLPLSCIAESIRPGPDDIQKLGGDDQCVFVRGKFVPILDVGNALGYRPALEDMGGKVMLLVENDRGQSYAYAVDEIVDQRQVVIKGLQDNYGRIEGVAAATILGDGQIALILDVNDLGRDAAARAVPGTFAGQLKEAAHA